MRLSRHAALAGVSFVSVLALVSGIAPSAHADDAVDSTQKSLAALRVEASEAKQKLEASQRLQKTAQEESDRTGEELAAQRQLVEEMKTQVGRVAVAERQRGGGLDFAKLLFTDDREDTFLADVTVMHSVSSITSEQLIRLQAEQDRLDEFEQEQNEALAKVDEEVVQQKKLSASYQDKVKKAENIVSSLTAAQKQRLADAQEEAIRRANEKLFGSSEGPFELDGLSLPTGPGQAIKPVNAPITSPFGYRINPIGGNKELHDGTDFGAPCGTPVLAAWTGVVNSARAEGGWGNRVIIDSGVYRAAYNHMQSIAVSPGQKVAAGQVVGMVGTTGYSTGCHLHFTVWQNGKLIDPVTAL